MFNLNKNTNFQNHSVLFAPQSSILPLSVNFKGNVSNPSLTPKLKTIFKFCFLILANSFKSELNEPSPKDFILSKISTVFKLTFKLIKEVLFGKITCSLLANIVVIKTSFK